MFEKAFFKYVPAMGILKKTAGDFPAVFLWQRNSQIAEWRLFIMEMDMEFLRKLPTPEELKQQFPIEAQTAVIKAERDIEICNIFEEKTTGCCW